MAICISVSSPPVRLSISHSLLHSPRWLSCASPLLNCTFASHRILSIIHSIHFTNTNTTQFIHQKIKEFFFTFWLGLVFRSEQLKRLNKTSFNLIHTLIFQHFFVCSVCETYCTIVFVASLTKSVFRCAKNKTRALCIAYKAPPEEIHHSEREISKKDRPSSNNQRDRWFTLSEMYLTRKCNPTQGDMSSV